ncbi:signal peptidase I [Marmoricola sp. RAF53]|uniref:signal peptidase I n=1 Tax=Marmoricola sp. RAF53 TaxID=3233059 RepID=UPI003F9B725A
MTDTTARRWTTRAGQLLLTGTAVVGACCLVLVLLALVTGARPLVFRSGSMEPAVSTGALGFARKADAADLRVGDVVTVVNAQGKTITHRIVAIGPGEQGASLRLQGDDNPTPDDEVYHVTSAPRLWFAVPGAGYVVAWFSGGIGGYLLGGYVVLMLMIAFRRRPSGDDGTAGPVVGTAPAPVASEAEQNRPRGRHRYGLVGASVVAVLVVAVVAGWSRTTWAAWNDSVAVTGASISTGTWSSVATPTITGCTNPGGNALNLTWTWGPGNPTTGFEIRTNKAGGTSRAFGPTIRNNSSNSGGYNGYDAEIWVVAISGSNVSAASAHYFVTGSGGGKTCTLVP